MIRRFTHGHFAPLPTLLATLWPDAEHQLCVFHVMQDINDQARKLSRTWLLQ
jgi:transposase-like protein